MIKIKAFNAGPGDSFLISFPIEKFNVLVDGGYKATYTKQIEKELIKIKDRGESLDLLVITHIDNDHINGIIELIKKNGSFEDSKIIKINEIWFNSYFNSPSFNEDYKISKEALEILKKSIQQNDSENYSGDIGIEEAKSLSKLLLEGKYQVNTSFDFLSVYYEKDCTFGFNKNIYFKIVSPTIEDLWKLDEEFMKKIGAAEKKTILGYNTEVAELYEKYIISLENESLGSGRFNLSGNNDIEELAALEDIEKNSLNNTCSIAFIVEYRKKKMLFLGDASLNIYRGALENIYKDKIPSFDLVKVSHHGSKYNISSDFLKKIKCKKFLISTDGSGNHEHPDKETIAKILKNVVVEKEIIVNIENQSKARWIQKLSNDEVLKKKYKFSLNIKDSFEV